MAIRQVHGEEAEVVVPIAKLKKIYSNFGPGTAELLSDIYDDNVIFVDPVHEINGLPALQRYFSDLAQNMASCRFIYGDELVARHKAYISWQMHFSHPKLAAGKEIVLNGASRLEYNEKIVYHEDFYDLGAMFYEHLPVFGALTRWLKMRLAR